MGIGQSQLIDLISSDSLEVDREEQVSNYRASCPIPSFSDSLMQISSLILFRYFWPSSAGWSITEKLEKRSSTGSLLTSGCRWFPLISYTTTLRNPG